MTVVEQYAVSEFTEVCFCASKKKKKEDSCVEMVA